MKTEQQIKEALKDFKKEQKKCKKGEEDYFYNSGTIWALEWVLGIWDD